MLKWRCLLAIAFAPVTLFGQALANLPFKDGPAPGFVLESWTAEDGLPVNTVTRVLQSRTGYIWLSTFDGLVRFDGVRFTTFNIGNSEGLTSNRIVELNESPDGSLLLATELNQLLRFKDGKFTLLNGAPHFRGRLERQAQNAPDGKVWTTDSYEIRVDGRLAYRVPEATKPASVITWIAPDREGSLWFGTVSAGLHQLKPAVFTMYGLRPGHGDNNLYSVTDARSGGIWAGPWGENIVSKIEDGALTTFSGRKMGFTAAVSLHEDKSGTLWIGGTPCRMVEARCGPTSTAITGGVRAFHEDDNGTLWFGTDHGLVSMRQGVSQSFSDKPGAPNTTIRAIERTKDGALWLATNGKGIVRFANDTFTSITTREGLPSDLIRALYEDSDGYLWAGTEGKGLARLDPREWKTASSRGKIINVRSVDGLFDDGIHTILADNYGRIWMSTNRGIFWVPFRELSDFANRRISHVRSTAYTERHGLRNREANGGSQPAATRTADGRLWFATQDGVAMVDPAHLANTSTPPNVQIEQVIAGGSPLTGSHDITPDRRDLRIEFTALSLLAPENIRFRYRLVPYDKDWVDADTRRSATYTKVPPGSYTFQVVASNGGDIWSSRPASTNLEVVPQFFETNTFKLLVFLAVALIIWAGVRWRIARLSQLSLDLQHRVDERTLELRAREKLLAEQNAQLEAQADQLQDLDRAKTRFFANVSHELRTPLTLTIGPLEDARSHLSGNGSHGALSRIDMALRNARRLFRLVNQILDVSKLEAGGTKLHAQPGNLAEFIRGIASAFSAVAERKNITFRVDELSEARDVWFDPDALEKVVANLLSNAFKFTPEHGGILVSVDTSGNTARVRVSDSGPGIPAEHVAHIFDRFYQIDETNTRAQPGTGIGLSLARELAELHGGTIDVESAAGGGATFTLSLPMGREHLREDQMVQAADEPSAEASNIEIASVNTAPEPAHEKLHVPGISDDSPALLVVDDNADLRTYVRSRFESRYRIFEAADGADAIRRAREVIPDLIISDVMMPGMDGHAMCAALKDSPETDFIPVILLTAQAEQDQRIAGLGKGADDYVVKPFDMRELEVRVDNLIASRRRLRERYSGKQLSINTTAESMSASDKAFIERLKTAVEGSLSDPDFGVSELAQAVFHDRSHLFRRTRELFNETPSDLLRRLRLERAVSLLDEGHGSIAEVAYGAGFNSVSNFCRVFRAAYGATPSEYRERNAATMTAQPER